MMQNYCLLLWLFLLTGCSTLGWGQVTPTPVSEDVALQLFLTEAPSLVRVPTTPTPIEPAAFSVPHGLPLPLVDPLDVVGNVTIAGSPALAPLTRFLYADFINTGYRDTIRIEELSSDASFHRYCTQAAANSVTVDLVMADRPIRQSELESCLQHNRKLVALRVGVEAVAVVVHTDAAFVTSVSKAELAALFTARRWSDVRPAWPNREIIRIVPAEGDVAALLFINKILDRNPLLLRNAPATTVLEDGQAIANMVADTPDAVGFLNFADYQKHAAELRLVAVDGIAPRVETVVDGAYALTYPLLLYTDLETLATRPQVGAFLLYYLAHLNAMTLDKAGNFPVNETLYERTKSVLLTAMGQESYLAQFAPTATPAPLLWTPTVTPRDVLTSTVAR